MRIKEYVERNPIIYLLGTAVSVSVVVFGVVTYFCQQRMEVASRRSQFTISTLESELASIKRGLGDSKYIDVRRFVIPKDRAPLTPINPKSQYVSSGEFYAIVGLPEWNYEQMSVQEFSKEIYGEALAPPLKKMGNFRLYVWKADALITVTGPSKYFDVGPMIVLQRTPVSELTKAVAESLPDIYQKQTGERISPQDLNDVLSTWDRIYRGDIAQYILATELSQHFIIDATDFEHINSQLLESQKVGNVLYLQFLTTLHNAEVAGQHPSVFFVREEMLIITDQDYVTNIHIIVPSGDPAPRGVAYTRVQEWFSGLIIPVR
jgi:hypothetical protein